MSQDETPKIGEELLPVVSSSLQVVPNPPKGLTPEADAQLRQQTEQLAVLVRESLEDRAFLTRIDGLGRAEQQEGSQRIELIEGRISSMVSRKKPEGEIDVPNAVLKMRSAMDELNPSRAKQSLAGRVLEKIPFIGPQILEWWWASGLREMAVKRETVRSQIKAIKESLDSNRTRLLGDNVQLDQLFEMVRGGTMANLQRQAYIGELLLEKLAEILQTIPQTETGQRDRMQRAIERVTVRVMHLRETEHAIQQGLATIDITVDGNHKLAESLERTGTLTTAYLTVAMALYQALQHQQQAIQAVIRAKQGTGEVMVRTSEMAKAGAQAVSDIYYRTVVAMEQIETAQQNLLGALQQLEDASRDGVVSARSSINKLRGMTEELREKQEKLRASRQIPETVAPRS